MWTDCYDLLILLSNLGAIPQIQYPLAVSRRTTVVNVVVDVSWMVPAVLHGMGATAVRMETALSYILSNSTAAESKPVPPTTARLRMQYGVRMTATGVIVMISVRLEMIAAADLKHAIWCARQPQFFKADWVNSQPESYYSPK